MCRHWGLLHILGKSTPSHDVIPLWVPNNSSCSIVQFICVNMATASSFYFLFSCFIFLYLSTFNVIIGMITTGLNPTISIADIFYLLFSFSSFSAFSSVIWTLFVIPFYLRYNYYVYLLKNFFSDCPRVYNIFFKLIRIILNHPWHFTCRIMTLQPCILNFFFPFFVLLLSYFFTLTFT